MSRGVWVRFILVLGLLAGCAALAINVKPNLGLDLRGGAQFVFEAEGTEQTPATAENVDKTLQVLRGRVDALGVAESVLVRQGENRILVELPGVTSDEEAQEAEERIGSTAKLTIHEVLATAQPEAEPSEEGNLVLPSDQGDTLEVGPTVIEGEEISGASAVQREQSVEWVVAIDFNGPGGGTWADITGTAACNPSGDPKRRIAIVLDGEQAGTVRWVIPKSEAIERRERAEAAEKKATLSPAEKLAESKKEIAERRREIVAAAVAKEIEDYPVKPPSGQWTWEEDAEQARTYYEWITTGWPAEAR